MLEPLDRRHLLDALRPPDGYDVDLALGTTYSLDLLTLLTVPLAFAMFDWEDDEGRITADPIALLEAASRYADRIHIFCQAGHIQLPKQHSPLLYRLENIVHPVNSPRSGGIFHPKLWIIRFAPRVQTDPILYRVLCLSRNLTFDRSWDTMLVLDGELSDRNRPISGNNPLGDLIHALPAMMVSAAGDDLRKAVARVDQEIRRVRFDVPPGFEDVRFHVYGIGDVQEWWFNSCDGRMLAVAPFVDAVFLRRFASQSGGDGVLVSRLEQLQALAPASLNKCGKAFYLDPGASAEPEPENQDGEELSGLHAKLYVADAGWNASVWTGSANATSAAMNRNVELLAELVGKRSVCGVEEFLRTVKGQSRIADMLREFEPAEGALEKDTDAINAEERANALRRALVAATLVAEVKLAADGQRYDVTVSSNPEPSQLPSGEIAARIWPIGLQEREAIEAGALLKAGSICFKQMSFESLSSFFAFSVSAKVGKRTHTIRFVMNLPIRGMPEDREERMLRSILSNKNQVLKMLLLLLADSSADMMARLAAASRDISHSDTKYSMTPFGETALLEPLLRVLSQSPQKLERIARLVDDLLKTPAGEGLLPAGFMAAWKPIWDAAQKSIREQR